MVKMTPWVERSFSVGQLPIGAFPSVLERFRGTPVRARALIEGLSPELVKRRDGNAWSMQEHIGHLLDLEELGEQRLRDFLSGATTLAAADMSNNKTHSANHNNMDANEVLTRFAAAREDLTIKLDALDEAGVARSALHPRLNQPMRVIDWVYFMSEHDDHHLAKMRELRHLGLRSSS
jgi:hypothetical protein